MPRTLQSLSVHVFPAHPGQRWETPSAAMLPALRDLELDNFDWTNTAQFEALIESGVLPQLRTLSLLLRGPYAPPRAFTDALAGLETLIISTLPEKACVLPPGLWHLGFHNRYFSYENQVARAQLLLDAARALPKLRLVTATRLLDEEVLDAFKRACRDYKVDFAVYEKLECFPRPQHVDWI
ncbi:hypothetical protein FA95DRAFT_1578713 [Auriscalpium vulgare]|uniref:Uncharacterized protein n=1 Tax=Auriscalpium vulgare TaxID=40419 RepID=A0ACB8R136_9AGAM|nr:hypothetical protein FA95DRAFT_1578713 [Auriscalpium vulgare]